MFSGFYTAVPGSMVQPYFSAPAAISDGPAVTVLERAPERSEGEPEGRVSALDGPQTGQGPQAAERSEEDWGAAPALPGAGRPLGRRASQLLMLFFWQYSRAQHSGTGRPRGPAPTFIIPCLTTRDDSVQLSGDFAPELLLW